MLDRDNLPGLVLLGLCAVVAGALMLEIAGVVDFEFRAPGWVGTTLTIVAFGLIISTFLVGRGLGRIGKTGGPRRWPWRRDRDDANRH
jgi:hypothetical protein